jgi:enoyl-CoA hydratase/carnithine racemase
MSLADGFRMELFFNRMLQATEDFKEGSAAFAEKRNARFTST